MMSEVNMKSNHVSNMILELDLKFLQWVGKPALRPEARLILLLGVRGRVSVKEAMHDSSLSHRSFYLILDKLKNLGILNVIDDEKDARVRRIIINEDHIDRYQSLYHEFSHRSYGIDDELSDFCFARSRN